MPHLIQVVTQTYDPVSIAIRIETHSWASHAEFVDSVTGETLGAHAIGGVKIRPYRPDKYTQVRRYVAPGMEEAYQHALTQCGKPYDFSAIAATALHLPIERDWRDPAKWFCSELLAWSFEKALAPLFSRDSYPFAIWPRDIPMSLATARVY